jgi:superfamily II DNA or RNA helicase
MTQLKPVVDVVKTSINIPVSENYHEMVDSMVTNNSRNTLIQGLAVGEALNGHKVLILTKRREHCEILLDKLKDYGAYYADSKDKDRNEILGQMRNGDYDFNILIGTVSLLATGTDIPSLDVVMFAGDLKSDILVEQGAGRILRLFEGKANAKIIDLFDDINPIFKCQFFERRKFYMNKGWNIVW